MKKGVTTKEDYKFGPIKLLWSDHSSTIILPQKRLVDMSPKVLWCLPNQRAYNSAYIIDSDVNNVYFKLATSRSRLSFCLGKQIDQSNTYRRALSSFLGLSLIIGTELLCCGKFCSEGCWKRLEFCILSNFFMLYRRRKWSIVLLLVDGC